MLTTAIIIYIVVGFVVDDPVWPLGMFSRGGCIGQILSIAWVLLLIAALSN